MENYEFRKAMHLVFFFGFLTAFILIVIPIYLAGIGLTGYQIGLLVAVYAITSIFVSFPTGLVNDGWTVRNTMILGIFLFSVFLIGTGFFTDFILLIPLFIIGGLGTNLAAVSLRTIIYKIKMKGEGRKFGTYRFVDVMGSAVGVLLVGVLISILDFSLGLKIIGLLYLLLIPLVSFKTHKAHKIELVDYEKDIVNRKVIPLAIVMFIFALHWGAESTSYGLFLQNNLGLDIFMVSLYSAFAIIPLALTSYYFGKRIDKKGMNMRNLFAAGLIISGVFHILHTVPIPWLSFIFRLGHEAGDGIAFIAVFFWISKLFSKNRIGGDSSLMFTVMLLGQVVGSLVFGPLGQLMGYHIPLIISGFTNILCAVLLVIFVRKFKIKTSY